MHEPARRHVPSAPPTRLGRYHIIETLGQGGMGTIQLAVVGGLGQFRKLVVLKVLRDELARDGRFVEMFMREAALAACLSHPNVVQTIEAGQLDGRYFLVMEFLDGQPLSRVLRSAQRLPVVPLALRLSVMCETLLGLHYAHELTGYDGVPLHMVHRDVSPSNVFVTYDGQVKLLDFGIAESRDSEESQPGAFKGKLGYASPEQLYGLPSDRRSDVFAAGVMLWEMIALRHLTVGNTARQTFASRVAGTEPRIQQVMPELDSALALICDRALQTDPDLRYQTADEFRCALSDYLTERQWTVPSAQIGQLMREKFESERAGMHRIIDAHLREPVESDSRVIATKVAVSPADPLSVSVFPFSRTARPEEPSRSWPSSDPSAGSGDVLVDSRTPGRWTRLWVAVVVLVSLLGGAAVWWSRVQLAATPRSSSAAPQRAEPAVVPAPPVPEPPPVSPEPAPEVGRKQTALPTKPALHPGRQDDRPAGLKRATELLAAPRARPRKPATSGDDAPATAPTSASPKERAAPPKRGESESLDLHHVPVRTRRAIDVDNPFR